LESGLFEQKLYDEEVNGVEEIPLSTLSSSDEEFDKRSEYAAIEFM
jgi:hypothetical protein